MANVINKKIYISCGVIIKNKRRREVEGERRGVVAVNFVTLRLCTNTELECSVDNRAFVHRATRCGDGANFLGWDCREGQSEWAEHIHCFAASRKQFVRRVGHCNSRVIYPIASPVPPDSFQLFSCNFFWGSQCCNLYVRAWHKAYFA